MSDGVDSVETVEDMLDAAVSAVRKGGISAASSIDALSQPVYVTDADGNIVHFNKACVGFAGRQPQPGVDRWCVTWKSYTVDGEAVPHDRCPMAVALQEKRPVRGAETVGERPDGSRVHFVPYPTPILGDDGSVKGGINLLFDITDRRIAELKQQAAQCRRISSSAFDPRTREAIDAMASDCEAEADRLSRRN